MYRKLKEKTKITLSDCAYEEQISTMLISMFKYENLPFRHSLIELLLLTTGSCGIFKDGDNLKCGWVTFTGNINQYGFGEDCVIYTLNNTAKDFQKWETSTECVIIFNNNMGCPDPNIERFAKQLTDIDKSIENAVINTRNTKVYRAKDEKERNAINSAIENNESGKPQAIISANILSDFLDGDNHNNYIIDLTDPTQSDKIQYLSNLHNDFLRRLYNIYGMMSQGSDKIAQQSVAEINNGSSAPFIIPLDRLNERQKGIERVNSIFGTNISISFGEAIKNEYEKIFVKLEEDSMEDSKEDSMEDSREEGVDDEN